MSTSIKWALGSLLLFGCATLKPLASQLADVYNLNLPVHFLGKPPVVGELYTCGLMNDQMRCVTYEDFEKAKRNENP